MSYRHDPDLEFLRNLESGELNDFVEVLLSAKTNFIESNEAYKKHNPDHKKYIEIIMADLQAFGGNSFANIYRDGGVYYKEILCDVCDKLRVNYNEKSSCQTIEMNLLMKVATDAFSKMSEEELKQVANELGLAISNVNLQSLTGAFQAIFKAGGFESYKITLIIVNAVWRFLFGKGLSFGANMLLTKVLSVFAGPIGWAITGVWTAVDIAGPAYRVTIPAVLQVAYLRQACLNKDEINKIEQRG